MRTPIRPIYSIHPSAEYWHRSQSADVERPALRAVDGVLDGARHQTQTGNCKETEESKRDEHEQQSVCADHKSISGSSRTRRPSGVATLPELPARDERHRRRRLLNEGSAERAVRGGGTMP